MEDKELKISVKNQIRPPIIEEKPEVIEKNIKITEEVLKTKKCPKCYKPLQDERIKLIELGKNSFCPSCFQVIKGKVTKPVLKATEIKEKIATEPMNLASKPSTIKTEIKPKPIKPLELKNEIKLKPTKPSGSKKEINTKPVKLVKKAPKKPSPTSESKQKKDEIKEMIKIGDELTLEDKEKAKYLYEDALEIAIKIGDKDLIKEIRDKMYKTQN